MTIITFIDLITFCHRPLTPYGVKFQKYDVTNFEISPSAIWLYFAELPKVLFAIDTKCPRRYAELFFNVDGCTKSGFSKSPGGGKTTWYFMVNNQLDWTELHFQYHSRFPQYVSNLQLIQLLSVVWLVIRRSNLYRVDFFWRSQTPPMWLPEGGLFFHVTQSGPPFCRKCDILSSSISERDLYTSDLVPTKLLPLLHLT